MPSLATGIGRGLQTGTSILSFLNAQERQRLQDERMGLLNELTRERIADIKSTRKLLEQQTYQEGMKEIAGQHQAAVTGVNLRDILLGGGATRPQAELGELGYYESGKIPSQAFGMISPKAPEKPKEYQVDRDISAVTDLILSGQPVIGPSIPRSMAREQATKRVYGKKYPTATGGVKAMTFEEADKMVKYLQRRRTELTEGYALGDDSPEVIKIDEQLRIAQNRADKLLEEELGVGQPKKKVRVKRTKATESAEATNTDAMILQQQEQIRLLLEKLSQ